MAVDIYTMKLILIRMVFQAGACHDRPDEAGASSERVTKTGVLKPPFGLGSSLSRSISTGFCLFFGG
jgi:hypothetical protein